ncbi:hypothetical protein JCGZ_08862 [Jatropha curcas]|uniref:Uncharacterized protein n=1 Tax=Jatropha curcas TaxID=180498 RepID=A0A067KXY7_JATCU|nr:hypothetical protein JCGZ_08862 [Jatropha curcas]
MRSHFHTAKIDPSREISSRVWRRQPDQRLVRVLPIPERAPVSSVVSSSSSDSVPDLDSVIVEMADITANETVEERETPEPALGNQASADNLSLAENELIKQITKLKDKVERISISKEKDPVTNFDVAEYVLKPTNSTSSKTFKHTLFEGDNDPRSHLSEFIQVAQMNRYDEEDVLRAFPQTLQKSYRRCGTKWSQKISEFEDFLGIGDEASRMVQEQKSKARILQSILAAEDAEEAERKVMKMSEREEMKEKATPKTDNAPNAMKS